MALLLGLTSMVTTPDATLLEAVLMKGAMPGWTYMLKRNS
jgi:hypothetical protein